MLVDIHCHCPADEAGLDELRRGLGEGHVDHTTLLASDIGVPFSERFPFMSRFCQTNEDTERAWQALQHSERVHPFAYVDPRQPDAATVVRHWVRERGFRGVKLYPPIGFYPDAPEAMAFYEAINDLRVPMLIHMGRVAPHPSLRSKYCQPVYLEGPCMAAPDCAIICGHFGNPWAYEAWCIGWSFPNLYLDLTTSGMLHKDLVAAGCNHEYLGAHRFLFGTDGPEVGRWQEAGSHREEMAGLGMTPAQLDEVFGLSAARILGVTPTR
jgi:predicted TIM-barrel fold metal-dependent hydrolase